MLLLIDTSTETASVMISADGNLLGYLENDVARDHSAWLHPAISELLKKQDRSASDIKAVAVTSGPGSYTGLRVGMAAGKGLCYALKVPLITCNNLLLMATSLAPLAGRPDDLLCPMIDARRMEVFTAIYTVGLELVRGPEALILDKTSFEQELSLGRLLFSGSGSAKWKEICSSTSAQFCSQPDVKQTFVKIASSRFISAAWADTVYSEPEYGKDFHTHVII